MAEEQHDRKHKTEPALDGSRFSMGWSTLSVILAVIAISAIASLVVVASITKADALSTVALGLAVLAFAAQLIVTMAQGQQASQLTADTKAALAELRATTDSLVETQRGQFDRVLRAAIERAVPAVVQEVAEGADGSGDPVSMADVESRLEALSESLITRVQREISGQQNRPSPTTSRRLEERSQAAARLMKSYPSREEGESLLPIARALTADETSMLLYLAQRFARTGSNIGGLGSGPPSDAESALVSKGLITAGRVPPTVQNDQTPQDKPESRVLRLTDAGKVVVRLLNALNEAKRGDIPAWLAAAIDPAGS